MKDVQQDKENNINMEKIFSETAKLLHIDDPSFGTYPSDSPKKDIAEVKCERDVCVKIDEGFDPLPLSLLNPDDSTAIRPLGIDDLTMKKTIKKESGVNVGNLFVEPVNVAVLDADDSGSRSKSHDDSAIKRITMGSVVKTPFGENQSSTTTTPRRPPSNQKYYVSNTIVTSDGDVYHVEPFMLPPPHQISDMMKELASIKRERGDSNLGLNSGGDHKESTGQGLFRRKLPRISTTAVKDEKLLCDATPPTTPKRENSDQEDFFDSSSFSLRKYLQVEMFGIGGPSPTLPTGDAAVKQMNNFFFVIAKVEQLISFGFFICLDAFLYVVTYLPLRVVFASGLLVAHCACFAIQVLAPSVKLTPILFHRTHAFDLMRGSLLLIGYKVLHLINMGTLYHYIRGQTTIKLYVLTAMLEVFAKLFGSFGQDAFDSLFSQVRTQPFSFNLIVAYVIVAIYVIMHSSIYFAHIATLTVAMNSAEQALVTLLVLNNFAEVKSFVFKKFDRGSLFQLSCGDITERFQLMLFLLLIMGASMAQAGGDALWVEVLYSHMRVIALMFSGEALADWIKHAFISKFMALDSVSLEPFGLPLTTAHDSRLVVVVVLILLLFTCSTVSSKLICLLLFDVLMQSAYSDFFVVLRKDVLNAHKEKIILDHTYAITRRLGMSQVLRRAFHCP